jgi:hypothetical protein
VLSTAVEEIALPTRNVAAALQKCEIPLRTRDMVGISRGASTPFYTEDEAWHLVGICFLGARAIPEATFEACMEWFYGSTVEVGAALLFLDKLSKGAAKDIRVEDLLPYIIDAHGPGSRLSVRKSPNTATSRARKKANGVFYTPSDVADFMAHTVLSASYRREPPLVLDPAVGTGVFLRATLSQLRQTYIGTNPFVLASSYLFGADVDQFALNGAAFVLLNEVWDHLPDDLGPSQAWLRLRANLVQVDSILLDIESGTLGQYFPRLKDGADVVIGNPPYAPIGNRPDLAELAARLQTLAAYPNEKADLYPIFVEQMIRLAHKDGSGAMVVPLSLACNGGAQFSACRKLIERTLGLWRLAFFDREPHALFGEDVKTRNTIVFHNALPEGQRKIMAGPLRRWRSGDRAQMLSSICFTDVGESSITDGVPKIIGTAQAKALKTVTGVTTLGSLLLNSGKTNLSQLPSAHKAEVLVGPTAYNFLNVARATVLPLSKDEELSENALHRFMALDEEVASAVYALLSTDFTFWWWYVHGDGFHVNLAHLLKLPVGQLDNDTISALSRLGQKLWADARKAPIKSSNKGRVTFAFPTRPFSSVRHEVQRIQCGALGLSDDFTANIDAFVSTVVDARLFPPHNQNN